MRKINRNFDWTFKKNKKRNVFFLQNCLYLPNSLFDFLILICFCCEKYLINKKKIKKENFFFLMFCKKLRKQLFERNNNLIFRLPDLNARELYILLKRKQLKSQARRFYRENICGSEFISIVSNFHGSPILREDLRLTQGEIEELQRLYLFIYKLRRIKYKKLLEKEIPYYIGDWKEENYKWRVSWACEWMDLMIWNQSDEYNNDE